MQEGDGEAAVPFLRLGVNLSIRPPISLDRRSDGASFAHEPIRRR